MRVTRMVPLVWLVLASCKGFPFWWRAESDIPDSDPSEGVTQPSSQPVQAEVEMQDVRFDGETLRGRLLVGAKEQSIILDKRLFEAMSLTTESVTECGTGRELSFIIMDVYAPRRTEQDVLLLKPGYWYGKQVRVPLFTSELQGQQEPPACIEVHFTFHALRGQPAGQLTVRAEKHPAPAPDTGTGGMNSLETQGGEGSAWSDSQPSRPALEGGDRPLSIQDGGSGL